MDLQGILDQFNFVQQALKELVQISREQQEILHSGDGMERLETLFEIRGKRFEEFIQGLENLHKLFDANPSSRDIPQMSERLSSLNNDASLFYESDERVQQLLTLHIEKTGWQLLQRHRFRSGIRDYRAVESATGTLSRIFPGNTRYLDEKR